MRADRRAAREGWRQAREQASSPPYRIAETVEGWVVVVGDDRRAGPFETHSEAWRWIDRNRVARRYGQ
jgi:hypothetical protein